MESRIELPANTTSGIIDAMTSANFEPVVGWAELWIVVAAIICLIDLSSGPGRHRHLRIIGALSAMTTTAITLALRETTGQSLELPLQGLVFVANFAATWVLWTGLTWAIGLRRRLRTSKA